MNISLNERVAVVTGATRGIGKAIAMSLAQAGAEVIGTATTKEGAQAITVFFADAGLKGRGQQLNVNDEEAMLDFCSQLAKEYGRIDILVNNAGITSDNLSLRMKNSEWSSVLATNLTAVFNMCQKVLKHMLKAQFGRIINITSVVGSIGNPGQANYAATKAGVAAMSRVLAAEVGQRGITVNCVAPGFIETAMTDKLNAEQKNKITSQIPLKKLGSVMDIANAVTFLASDEAAYISGTTLHVNGGLYMS